MNVIVGRYSVIPRRSCRKDDYIYGSDAFCIPDYRVFGVATSFHHYHLYPISQQDVQAAFNLVRSALLEPDSVGLNGTELLRSLLQAVHRGFIQIDVRDHIAGLEFESQGIPDLLEPIDDPEATPQVRMILLQLHRGQLSIASVGDFVVYVLRSTGYELIYGYDWFRDIQGAGAGASSSQRLAAQPDLDLPEMGFWKGKVESGDLIVAATQSLVEIIALAKLEQLIGATEYNLQAINRSLMTTLRDIIPTRVIDIKEPHLATKSLVGRLGAAWAITYVEK